VRRLRLLILIAEKIGGNTSAASDRKVMPLINEAEMRERVRKMELEGNSIKVASSTMKNGRQLFETFTRFTILYSIV
jgi:hypothetical protein